MNSCLLLLFEVSHTEDDELAALHEAVCIVAQDETPHLIGRGCWIIRSTLSPDDAAAWATSLRPQLRGRLRVSEFSMGRVFDQKHAPKSGSNS